MTKQWIRMMCLVSLASLSTAAGCKGASAELQGQPNTGADGVESTPGQSAPPELSGDDGLTAQRGSRAKVLLVPLRSFSEDLLVAVEDSLEAELGVEVERHVPVALPDFAYYEPRRRYRADALLDFLEDYADEAEAGERWGPGRVKVLGLTEVDISTSSPPHEDWGIFGLGRSPGRVAVVSSKRLKRKPKNREHVRFRVATTAVHEIGHTLGLPHCSESAARCVMLDAEGGIANTDLSTGTLGPLCARQVERSYPRIP